MIKVCKTNELSNEEWIQLTDGFNRCFNTSHSVEHLKNFYENTIKGYSYHALDIEDGTGKLRGYNSFLPTEYKYNNQMILGGISGGTYVLPEYRKDVSIFMNLMNNLFKYCRNEGMVIKVGVPNKNSFKYTIKVNKAKLVGYLNYYILPVKPFRLFRNKAIQLLNFFPYFMSLGCMVFNEMISTIFPWEKRNCIFELNTTVDFLSVRFSNRETYKHIVSNKYECYYRLYTEGNATVAYLMDFREGDKRTFKSLIFALKNIIKNEDIAMILYVGTMNMVQCAMIKLPHRFDPKPLPLTVNVLNKDKKILEDAVKMTSWDFGLINFDAR